MSKVKLALINVVVLVMLAGLAVLDAFPALAANLSSKVPNDIVLVLDNSGSMRKNDKNVVTKQVVSQFIKDATPNSHLAILIFDTNVKFAFRLAPATGATRDALLASLENLDFRGRWTNMPAAMNQALGELRANGRESAAKSVVLLTDGVVETGNPDRDREDAQNLKRVLASEASAQGVKLFTVALGPTADTELLQVLANKTLANYYWVSNGDDLPPVFERIHGTITRDARAPEPPKLAENAVTPESEAGQGTPEQGAGAIQRPAASVSAPVPQLPAIQAKKDRPRAQNDFLEPVPRASGPAPVNATTNHTVANWSWTVGGLLLLVGLLSGLLLRNSNTATPAAPMLNLVDRSVPMATYAPGRQQRTPQAFLQDISGVTGRPRHELDTPVTVVGRLTPHPDDPFGHIVIDQPTIGRRHAVIERRQHGFWVSDQHSKNGTYINGQRITDEVSLLHGDRIRFHEYDFEFFLAGWGLVDETVAVSDLRLVSNKLPEVHGQQG
jgi:hypothetical protein